MSTPNHDSITPHILVFPFPAQGHMLPLLDLTHYLALHGLTITILVTPKNLPILTSLLSAHPSSIHTLVFPMPAHPSLPPGVENVKDVGNHGNAGIISALHSLSDSISLWFRSHASPPIAILSDFFLGWTHHLATQLGLPRIAFYSSGAFLASVLHHLLPIAHQIQHIPDSETMSLPHLPNSPSFPRCHLPSVLIRYDESNPIQVLVRQSLIGNSSSWGHVFNTFDAVESDFLDHVRREMGPERVWAVGPVSALNPGSAGPAERDGPNSGSSSELFNWLDGCADGSVVYGCFGSQVFLSRPQVEALAEGLEQSGIRFILAVKQPPAADDVVPRGFEDRVAGRGVVIRGWAPQVAILSHRAVGGFLTHCGWNSVLEGLVAGTMLFAWPMEADQFVNMKLLVEYMGVAFKVCEGKDAVPDSAALARCIAESMSGPRSESVRAMELRDKALAAVKEGGSSARDLYGLVEELKAVHMEKEKGAY